MTVRELKKLVTRIPSRLDEIPVLIHVSGPIGGFLEVDKVDFESSSGEWVSIDSQRLTQSDTGIPVSGLRQ